MDKPPDNQVFSLPEEFIYKLFDESNEQLTVAKGLLKHYASNEFEGVACDTSLDLIARIIWINYSIIRALETEIDDNIYYDNKETNESELLISDSALSKLQTLVVSRYLAKTNLNNLSFSMSLH